MPNTDRTIRILAQCAQLERWGEEAEHARRLCLRYPPPVPPPPPAIGQEQADFMWSFFTGDLDRLPTKRAVLTHQIRTNAETLRRHEHPLYRPNHLRWPDTHGPLLAYLEIDPQKRTLLADYSIDRITDPVPLSVSLGRVVRLAIHPLATGQELADLLGDLGLLDMAQAVCDGHSLSGRGPDSLGELDERATAALEQLRRLVVRWGVEAGHAARWRNLTPEEWAPHAEEWLLIGRRTTTDELRALDAYAQAKARNELVSLDGDMFKYLEEIRAKLRDRRGEVR